MVKNKQHSLLRNIV